MSETRDEVLNLIKNNAKNEDEYKVNKLFFDTYFEYLGSSVEFSTKQGIIGEIDGIWSIDDNKYVILVETTAKKDGLTEKMERFFNLWSNQKNIELIKKNFKLSRGTKIVRIFFDLKHTKSHDELPSVEHIFRDKNNHYLNLIDYRYLERQIKMIGKHAKSDLLHTLKIPKNWSSDGVPAIRTFLGNEEVFLFSLTVKKLLETCYVSRRKDITGFQRILSNKKIISIKKAIKSDESITFPNSIIVSTKGDLIFKKLLEERNIPEAGILTLPSSYCSMKLVDGQHRLYGFAKLDDELLQNFNLIVVAYKEIEKFKEVYTFIKINSTQSRVDASLLYNLKADFKYPLEHEYYDERIAVLIAREFNKSDSILKNKIYFHGIEETRSNKPVTLATFVTALLKNQITGKNNFFNIERSELNEFYNKINDLIDLAIRDENPVMIKIIKTNLGIRLFFRLIFLFFKNKQYNTIKKSEIAFIDDLREIISEKFRKELFSYYGSGGANKAAFEVVEKLKKSKKEYEDFFPNMRGRK